MQNFDLHSVQKVLREQNLDGWLFYDFRGSDPIGRSILRIPSETQHSRRWFYFIPESGVPVKLVHTIERDVLDHLPCKKEVYLAWQEMESKLSLLFRPKQKIALQYSPKNVLPYISRIDAGMLELLKTFKIKPVSAAGLVQYFEARLSSSQLNTHISAARTIQSIIARTFEWIKTEIAVHSEINEYLIQQYIISEMEKHNLVSEGLPLVAAGVNSANPHYMPGATRYAPVFPGSIVQLDIAARERNKHAVYADLSWVGFVGDEVPPEYTKVFKVIIEARDSALEFIDQGIRKKKNIAGWQVDQVARKVIADAGYGDYFIHRTGHSIGNQVHANAVNLDSLETRDDRLLIEGLCVTIEPGIYFSQYGMRSEINAYIGSEGVQVYSTPLQTEIVPILA
jgi:Xaa-Pro dipeptidase